MKLKALLLLTMGVTSKKIITGTDIGLPPTKVSQEEWDLFIDTVDASIFNYYSSQTQ